MLGPNWPDLVFYFLSLTLSPRYSNQTLYYAALKGDASKVCNTEIHVVLIMGSLSIENDADLLVKLLKKVGILLSLPSSLRCHCYWKVILTR